MRKPTPPKSDDYFFFEQAKAINAGTYHLTESVKSQRLVVFAPVALITTIFGENPFSIALWPLLCSLFTIAIIFLFVNVFASFQQAFIAAGLIAFNILQIDYSAALFPDVIAGLFALLFIINIYNGRLANKRSHAITATAFFVIGFFAKETIVLLLPFVGILLITDYAKKRNKIFWFTFLITMISAFAALTFFYKSATGDTFFIFHSVTNNFSLPMAENIYKDGLSKRLTYKPIIFLFKTLAFMPLIAAAVFYFFIRKWKWEFDSFESFFTWCFIFLLAAFWFAPTSLSAWSPIPLYHFERMWLLLLSSLTIIASYLFVKIANFIQRPKLASVLVFPFFFLAIYFVIKNSNW